MSEFGTVASSGLRRLPLPQPGLGTVAARATTSAELYSADHEIAAAAATGP